MGGTRKDIPTDQRLLHQAIEEIRRFGSQRVTVVSIAQGLGLSHASVYRYFPSKQALIEAVTLNWLQPIEMRLRQIADGPDPIYDKLEHLLLGLHRSYRDKMEQDPHIFHIFLEAIQGATSVARKHRKKIQGEIARILEEGLSAGLFAAMDQRIMMALVFDMMHRFIHPLNVHLDRDIPSVQLEIRLTRVTNLLMQALAPPSEKWIPRFG